MTTKDILNKYKRIAVYGMSAKPHKPSFYVPMFLYNKGFEIAPINPSTNEIEGLQTFPSIADVEGKIEILDIFRRSEFCLDIVKEAVDRKKQKGDIDVIWLQQGIINDDAKKLALENGIIFVQDKCLMQEYNIYF